MDKAKLLAALKKLREGKERKFAQSADLIINLRDFDAKKESVNLFLSLPHKIRDVKVGAFLNEKSSAIDSITKAQFAGYKDKKQAKKLVNKYDYFVASAGLMPLVASTFGKYLGPAGKMPSPQLGIIREENDNEIRKTLEKFEKVIRIKSKEPSLKFGVGKESMKDEEIAENAITAYNSVLASLPKKQENIKSIMIKFTMTKPEKLEIK